MQKQKTVCGQKNIWNSQQMRYDKYIFVNLCMLLYVVADEPLQYNLM